MAPFEKPPECIPGPNCPAATAAVQVENEVEVLRAEVIIVRKIAFDVNGRVDRLMLIMLSTLIASVIGMVFAIIKR